jgi:hypothetical protein
MRHQYTMKYISSDGFHQRSLLTVMPKSIPITTSGVKSSNPMGDASCFLGPDHEMTTNLSYWPKGTCTSRLTG